MNKKRWIASIVEIVLGIILWIGGVVGPLDSYWSGMGGGLIGVGIVQLIRQIRYNTNTEYKENFDIEAADERNRFIAMKAWSWAGYLFVMVAAVGSIVCKLIGREDLMMFCSGSVCLIVVLYWISYVVLKRKY